MLGLGTTEIIIVALVIMVLFGAKRLPDASRSLGRSLRIFKAETKGLRDDNDTTVTATPLDSEPSPRPTQTPMTPPPPPPAAGDQAQQRPL